MRDFQKRQYGNPPTILGVHLNRELNESSSNNGILETISQYAEERQESEGVAEEESTSCETSSDANIADENGFMKGQIVAFRGCDSYHFNAIELNRPYSLDSLRPRSKIKGNILTLVSDLHDNEDLVVFKREKEWENGHMLFAHVLRTTDDDIVQIKMKKVETPDGVYFCLDKKAFVEISEISKDFENSIVMESHEESADNADDESEIADDAANDEPNLILNQDQVLYVDRRQRRNRGNRLPILYSN